MVTKPSDSKTSFSWNWLPIVAAFLVMLGFYGTQGSFGLFVKPLEEALGSSRVAVSSAMSTFMGLLGIVGIFAGRLTDKYDVRIIIGIGAFFGVAGYLLMYWVGSVWQLHLYFGIMAGAAMGTCFAPVIATVSKWFSGRRVLVVGITTVGIAVGQMVVPPVVAIFMAEHEWRSAYLLLAAILFGTVLISLLLLRKPESQNYSASSSHKIDDSAANNAVRAMRQSKQWSGREAMRTVPFWMFCVVGFTTAAGFYIVIVHVIAFAIDTGIKPTDAALILTFLNGGLMGAQILIWVLTRKIGSRISIVLLLGIQALALFLLMGASGFAVLIAIGLLFGFGFGGSNTIRLSMVSEIFGTRSTGTILGLVSVAWAAGGICGPILAGYIFDLSQSYDVAFLVGGLLLATGAVAGFFLKAPRT